MIWDSHPLSGTRG